MRWEPGSTGMPPQAGLAPRRPIDMSGEAFDT
jgi:hypothetical protein